MIEASSPALESAALHLRRAAPQDSAASGPTEGRTNPFVRLALEADQSHRSAAARLSSQVQAIGSIDQPTTVELLRLQADVASFGMRTQLTVRIADEIGRGIQTLTQRS